jgi:hypothetical protein
MHASLRMRVATIDQVKHVNMCPVILHLIHYNGSHWATTGVIVASVGLSSQSPASESGMELRGKGRGKHTFLNTNFAKYMFA